VAALFLVLLQLPVPGAGTIMPALGAAWAAGLPLALMVASAAELPELPEAAERLLPDSGRELDDERRDAIWCAQRRHQPPACCRREPSACAAWSGNPRFPKPGGLTLRPHGRARLPACRAAVLAVYAAESLLLAFALKLRVAAALAGQRGPRPAVPAAAAALGLDDAAFQRAASFLGQCMPAVAQSPGSGRSALKVCPCLINQEASGASGSAWRLQLASGHDCLAGRAATSTPCCRRAVQGAGGMALQRLAQEGLSWVPTCCNLTALLCFGLSLALNAKARLAGAAGARMRLLAGSRARRAGLPCASCFSCQPIGPPSPERCAPPLSPGPQVTDGAPAAILLLAPVLLLLAQDPLLLPWLEDRRRYAPPCAAVTAYLAAAAAWQLVGDLGLQLGAPSAWAAWYLARNATLLLATLPCQLLLLAYLWRLHYQVCMGGGGRRGGGCVWRGGRGGGRVPE
jgi:hypothetical protein